MDIEGDAWPLDGAESSASQAGRLVLLDPPVEGFRSWSVWLTDPMPRLRSLVDPFHVWVPGKVVAAGCSVQPGGHAAPHPPCRCGVYALRTWPELEPYLHGDGPASRPIAGRVALWGRAVAGPRGWRARFGRLLEIIPLPGDDGLARDVASTYGVPITSDPRDWPGATDSPASTRGRKPRA